MYTMAGFISDEGFRLLGILNKRRKMLPDPRFHMVNLKRQWGQEDLMRWVIDNTVGEIYLTHNKIGFVDSNEAVMFALKFK